MATPIAVMLLTFSILTSQTDTPVPPGNISAGETPGWMIPQDSEKVIQRAMDGDNPLVPGVTLDSLRIENDSALACYARADSAKWCVRLKHPSTAAPEDSTAGPFVLKPEEGFDAKRDSEALDRLTMLLKRADGDLIWKKTVPKDIFENPSEREMLARNLIRTAHDLLDADMPEPARRIVDSAAKIAPRSPLVKLVNARMLAHAARWDEAETELKNSGLSPKDPDLLTEEARILALRGKYDEAVEKLAKLETPAAAAADVLDPRCVAEKFAGLLNKLKGADEEFQFGWRAWRRFPFCAGLLGRVSGYYLDKGNASGLLEMADSNLKARPDDKGLLSVRISALWRLKRYEDALNAAEKLYKLTGDKKLITMHSDIAAQMTDSEAVFARMKSQAEADPGDLMSRHCFAVLSYLAHDYPTTLGLMDELAKKLPEEPRVRIYGAMSRYQQGDSEGALEWLTKLDKLNLGNKDLYYSMAVVWHRRDPKKAIEYLDRYLAAPVTPEDYPPEHAQALKLRERLASGQTIRDWAPQADSPMNSYKIFGLAGIVAVSLIVGLFLLVGGRRRRT